MSHGRLCAIGTQLHLKRKWGEGAKLTLTLKCDADAPTPEAAAARTDAFLRAVVSPDISLVTHVGMTVAYNLPRTADANGGTASANAAASAPVDFASLFEALQYRREEAGFVEWGITQTSLDDVFVKVVEDHAARHGYAT